MKKLTKRRISLTLGIIVILSLNILLVILSSHVNDPNLNKIMYLAILGSVVIVGLYVYDLTKSANIVKTEKIQIFTNRIKFHEKEIEGYKKLIEQTEKDY
jgi:hypothetical protein